MRIAVEGDAFLLSVFIRRFLKDRPRMAGLASRANLITRVALLRGVAHRIEDTVLCIRNCIKLRVPVAIEQQY
jgi:hypothetical protein